MPLFPLPVGESSLTGGDVPVRDEQDVLKEFSTAHRVPVLAPVRDLFVSGFTAGFVAYQLIAAAAAAQCDPMRATGDNLKGYAEEHGVIPGGDESEDSVRARLFTAPKIVAPDFIEDGVNAILATVTDRTCHWSELGLDGWFVNDGTAIWASFVGASPDYPDRYYADIPSLDPGAARPPTKNEARSFLLRIPPLEASDELVTYVLAADPGGIFVTDGTETDETIGFFLFEDPQTAEDLYQQIIGFVESIKGQGISWTLLVDPTL